MDIQCNNLARYSLVSNAAYNAGSIEYIDPNVDLIDKGKGSNTFNLLLHKRKSFEHEKELRIVIPEEYPFADVSMKSENDAAEAARNRRGKAGLAISIDLNKLIENVYVAPSTPGWYKQAIIDGLNKTGLDKPVPQSDLDSKALI